MSWHSLTAAFLCAASLVFAADISGRWTAKVETDAGSGEPSFTFQQEGEKLTGTYSGALGEAKLAGTVQGDDVKFTFKVSPGGDEITVEYSGKLEGSSKMKGAVRLGSLGSGTWTASKN